MKIEAKFVSKNNRLYRISDDSEVSLVSKMRMEAALICGKELEEGALKKMTSELTATKNKILCVYLPWFLVENVPESYNEEVLASLRNFLKEIEEGGLNAIIVPQLESDSCPMKLFSNGETLYMPAVEYFIAAMKHTARRIKDCESIIGFAIPKEILGAGLGENSPAASYMEELSQKHAHYVYFASREDVENLNLSEQIAESAVVLY